MVRRRLVYRLEALDQITTLGEHIAERSSPAVAGRYLLSIFDYCEGLIAFPLRGRARDDLRPGLRVLGFDRTSEIVFAVSDDEIEILGFYYGGQDWQARFGEKFGESG